MIGVLALTALLLLPTDSAETPHYGLPINADGRLTSHHLLYTHCSEEQISEIREIGAALHELVPMDEELALLSTGKEPSVCTLVRLVKGMQVEHLRYPLPEKIFRYDSTQSPESLREWVASHCFEAEVGLVNQGSKDLQLLWLDTDGQHKDLGVLGPGEVNTRWMTSYLGHRFEVVDPDSQQVLAAITVESDGFYVVGDKPAPVVVDKEFLDQLEERVEMTVMDEWNKSRRVKRTFTGLGFSKGRLPYDLYASMSAYYYNNRDRMMREEWGNKGLFVNWWEVDARMIGMPWGLKKYWQGRLKKLVEEWAGVSLSLTDIYGMRQYEEGARLLMHVDRQNTHAASLIVNIAQIGMKQPWMLQIYDFADRMHEVDMEPGDIVYYESARCLHGRMRPLNGTAYINLFAHYQPMEDGAGDPQWYTKPNPPGTPKPILDFDNVCSIDETAAGAFKSCGGKKATSGIDIFDFWQGGAAATST